MGRIAIGKIQRSHGVKGFFKVYSFSGETQHFIELKEVYLLTGRQYKKYRVKSVKVNPVSIRLQLEGIDTPEQVKKLTGTEIWVDRELASPLREGEYYISDLCRCHVYQDGKEVGRVTGLLEGSGETILEVLLQDGRKLLVPFKKHFVGEIDTDRRIISLKEAYVID
jgi:16S rRNA processing protein RimM